MNRTRIVRVLGTVFAALMLVGGPLAVPASAAKAPAVRVVTYDASSAAEFRDVVHDAARIWNDSVDNVRLKAVTGNADVVIVADDGWPRARTTRLGAGKIWMGRQAAEQGHDATRIAAHEFGHIFGLPDRRTGRCADLMSGHSAGTSCTNAHPNAQEIAEVESNFARSVTIAPRLYAEEGAVAARR